MPDFPVARPINSACISTVSPESLGVHLGTGIGVLSASAAWPSANLAMYIPFVIYEPVTVVKMSIINGATVSGNVDVGIYDLGGSRRVSSGSTAQSGTSAIQTFDITDTLLLPGAYYMALACSNTTATFENFTVTAIDVEALGVNQQASAFALPSSATFAAFAQTLVPMITAHLQGTI